MSDFEIISVEAGKRAIVARDRVPIVTLWFASSVGQYHKIFKMMEGSFQCQFPRDSFWWCRGLQGALVSAPFFIIRLVSLSHECNQGGHVLVELEVRIFYTITIIWHSYFTTWQQQRSSNHIGLWTCCSKSWPNFEVPIPVMERVLPRLDSTRLDEIPARTT